MVPVQVFLDFDGTIMTKDTGTIIIDAGMGYETRRALDLEILNGTTTFRDAVERMWGAVTMGWDEAVALLADVPIDPKFDAFFELCLQHRIPITVVSSGIDDLVKLFLKEYLERAAAVAPGLLTIVANGIELDPAGWKIKYLDSTHYGHDKGTTLRAARAAFGDVPVGQRPLILYAGDGVSDLSAAREADVVLAKRGKDLHKWCEREGLAHTAWDDFSVAIDVVARAVSSASSSSSSSQ
ncbi:HAD-like domain-containing protein [Entophlyctis helioformis]|nr:HAD-like domain-containing protein [Entophlyctis helioformis]